MIGDLLNVLYGAITNRRRIPSKSPPSPVYSITPDRIVTILCCPEQGRNRDVLIIKDNYMTDEQRVKGKVIKVSSEGWGFISSKEIKFTRIFFHWTSLKQDTVKFPELKSGMKVEFTPVEIEGKGWRALKIEVLKDEVA
jgi:cold shock CspA family protein